MLAILNFSKAFEIKTDASKWAMGGALKQLGAQDNRKPVSCVSKALNQAQCNLATHDKELYAIVKRCCR